MSKICLVTGANGFIGSEISREIFRRGKSGGALVARSAVRRTQSSSFQERDCVVVGEINSATNWQKALFDAEVVIHVAARAHVLKENTEDPLAEFRIVNVDGTINLAEQALRAGVRRFIFVSSIGVNGNETFGQAFNEGDDPSPQEPYAVSKLEAEVALRNLFAGSQAQLVIVRPPLVYGPNPPGNFRRLLKLTASGLPLPLGAIHNKRSLVALVNLVDFILTCLSHPQAANQTFLVSDGHDLSTTELVRGLAHAAGVPSRLVPVPVWALQAGAALLGKRETIQRLCGNLQVDISKARNLLGWAPPISVDEGLRRAVAGTKKS